MVLLMKAYFHAFLDQQIEAFIEKWLLEGFGDFFKDFMVACGHEPEAGYIPIVVRYCPL